MTKENSDLLTLEEISRKLKDRKLHVVSKATGLSFPTLKKLTDKKSCKYNYSTLKVISDYFRKDEIVDLTI